MAREWVHEASARWDEAKAGVLGELRPELFGIRGAEPGAQLGDEWWRLEDDGEVIGFGRLDDVWGDAEILIMVAPGARGAGVGAEVLERLDQEAASRHLNYVYNRVHADHPQAADVVRWLEAHGFAATADGDYRRRVREGSVR
ncbi:MAG TPA: GNAT family N-acetyltransferase [Pseudonocardia sp.]|nr:GNAT family N-acetyltransferase [Pseudonocardia sp.]